jgi:hypothetical protein
VAVGARTVAAARNLALVAVDMGYGHLRAAHALADALGSRVLELDRPPLASAGEQRRWRRVRAGYEWISRGSQLPYVGRPLRALLDGITFIPEIYGSRKQSKPTLGVRVLEAMARRGLGKTMMSVLREQNATLVTTFYAPAVIADYHGFPRSVCVVTDTDINRAWVSRHAAHSAVHYCVPSERVQRRLRAFGVPKEFIHLTGFPLPPELLGGPDLSRLTQNLAGRLVRLDPKGLFREQSRGELDHFLGALPRGESGRPPLLTFALGGAGAQLTIVRQLLPSLRWPLERGRIRLAIATGVRRDAAERVRRWVGDAGLEPLVGSEVQILCGADFLEYYRGFNELLAETDILWTKPSEMTFYGALGIPLVFSRPVGAHERANRRWALHRGAGFKQESARFTWEWLREWLNEGTLAAAAWSGYVRLPKFGTYRIAEVVASLEP